VLTVKDVPKLEQALRRHGIRYDTNADPYVWVLELLKMGASSLPNLDEFGCELMPEYVGQTLVQIRDQIDHDFYSLSVAHHERYFGNSL